MNINGFTISNITQFYSIDLTQAEVENALALYETLDAAVRAGFFSPVTVIASDAVGVDHRHDGSAIILVRINRITIGETGSSNT